MSPIPLRKNGPFVELLEWPPRKESDPPRALRALGSIIENDLCHRCGSCVGICPTDVLDLDSEEYPVVANLSACTDCDLCVRVCPGDEFDALGIGKDRYPVPPPVEDMHGHIAQAYLAHATNRNMRTEGTSGGFITALLVSLLNRGEIDGALVVSSDAKELWKGRPILARTEEEIRSATKSKYAIAPTNTVFQEILKDSGRFAVVGLPCQIHGVIKAQTLDRRLKERIVLTVGLFCHAAVEHEPLRWIWKNLGTRTETATRFISRVGKHPGTPHLEHRDGSLSPVYFPDVQGYRPNSMEIINILYRLYTPARCLTCYDSTSEFADIAVGDPWMAPPSADIDFKSGYSLVFARNKRARTVIEDAYQTGDLFLKSISDAAARTANRMMGDEKRRRAFRVIETRRRQGRSVPEYGFTTPRLPTKERLLTELNMFTHFFCFVEWGKETLLKLTFSRVGYQLLRLNHLKRSLRDWIRDRRASRKSRG